MLKRYILLKKITWLQIEKSINGSKITFELLENSLIERKVMDEVLSPKFLIHSDALQPLLSKTQL